jgi:hypothetical protein
MTFNASGLNNLPDLLSDAVDAGATAFTLFDRITIPAGGATRFEIPSAEGVEPFNTIQGVVMHSQKRRAFWSTTEPREGNPPECSSEDGVRGIGSPGGSCKECPHSQWGSAPGEGRGKACKETQQLFILRDGEALPVALSLPPSSLGVFQQYVTRLTREQASIKTVVTEFSLEKQSSANGIAYSRINCKSIESIDDDSARLIRGVSQTLGPLVAGELAGGDSYNELPEAPPNTVDPIDATTIESRSAPSAATTETKATPRASDAIFETLNSLVDDLGVTPETLADYVAETYDGRSYMTLTTKEVLATIAWLTENYSSDN